MNKTPLVEFVYNRHKDLRLAFTILLCVLLGTEYNGLASVLKKEIPAKFLLISLSFRKKVVYLHEKNKRI